MTLVAQRHLDKLVMHIREAQHNGPTEEEIGELSLQCAFWCGAPAANSAFTVARQVIENVDVEPPGTG